MPLIGGNEIIGLAMGLSLHDFEVDLAGRGRIRELVGTPYIQCFQWLIENIIWLHVREGNNEALAFIHEQNDYQGEAQAAFNYVAKKRQRHQGPMTLTFAPKDKFAPLQAADALAYEANKRLRDTSKPNRKAIDVMNLGGRIDVQGFSRPNMKAFVDRIEVVDREIKTFGRPVSFLDE